MTEINFRFHHGLGDASNAAHLFSIWTSKGHKVKVDATADKAVLFQAAGCEVVSSSPAIHDWPHAAGPGRPLTTDPWSGNKTAANLVSGHLPYLGSYQDLWGTLVQQRLSLDPFIQDETRKKVHDAIESLPRPLVLFHSMGNTGGHAKNLTAGQQKTFIEQVLDGTDGAVLALDWDNRVLRFPHGRYRHLQDDLWAMNLYELYCLMSEADLIAAVDSGPLHFARFTNTPSLGIWTRNFPSHYVLPRPNSINVALAGVGYADWIPYRRRDYNIVTGDPGIWAAKMTSAPKYHADNKALDCLIEHLVSCQNAQTPLGWGDRHRSFDLVLKHLKSKKNPHCVEIGCMRQQDDWGAGMSSYVVGTFLKAHGGDLVSIDMNDNNLNVAKNWCQGLPIEFLNKHSHEFFRNYEGPRFDFYYADGADVGTDNYEAITLEEGKLALPHLTDDAYVLVDDSPRVPGRGLTGKGTTLVPFLKEQGFKILYEGYQVLLGR